MVTLPPSEMNNLPSTLSETKQRQGEERVTSRSTQGPQTSVHKEREKGHKPPPPLPGLSINAALSSKDDGTVHTEQSTALVWSGPVWTGPGSNCVHFQPCRGRIGRGRGEGASRTRACGATFDRRRSRAVRSPFRAWLGGLRHPHHGASHFWGRLGRHGYCTPALVPARTAGNEK